MSEERLCHKTGSRIQLRTLSAQGYREKWGGLGRRTNNFISEISLSTSSMNWMMKSTSLCFSISSVWKFVIRKDIS